MNEKTSRDSLFGSQLRERVLLLLALVVETHLREAAAMLRVSPNAVHKVVEGLERSGAVASRRAGRTRLFRLNPRWYAAAELRALLERLAAADTEIAAVAGALRHRPRRIGKAL